MNHLFDAYPSIHEAMDGLSNQDLDRHLQEMLNAGTDVPAFLRLMGDLMLGPDLVPMLGELREIFDIIRDPGAKYYNDTNAAATGGFYANNLLNPSSEHFFYTALDDMMKNVTISDDVFGIMQQVTGYLSAKTPDEIKQSMDDLSASIEKDADPVDGVPDIKVTIHDISAALAKVLLACDYPMWLDASKNLRTNRGSIDTGSDTNIELGNMVKGANLLLSGLGRFAHDDQKGRQMVKDLIQKELPPLFVPGNNVHDALEALIKNIGTYFIAGGSGPGYKYETTDYHNADPYVNAGIKETMRDMLPLLGKLVIRKNSDPNKDFSIFDNGTDQSPLDAVVLGLNKLKESGIDYSLDENALEPSLYKALTLNADGKDRTAGGNGKLSHLDHLVYTTAAAYFFGYLTRIGSDGEPDSNLGYGHGAATKGVLTINDSMYSMSSNSLMGLIDSYSAGLTQRTRQGAHVGRSFQPFSSDAIADHHFFIGYDSPGLSMLAQNAAGDSGIPNGGEPISPAPTTDETPTGGDVTARNNWKSYFVKVADGKGVLNTSEFMLSWFVRACWDGQGPYYATSGASTTTFTMPVHGTQTVNVYKKPNGEVYAYVYKPDASPSHWEYYYPTSAQTGVGNDAADPDDLHGQRINRYKVDCKSDNYIIQVDYDDFGTLNIGYVAPPMNPDGSANMDENSTTLPSKYNLKKQATVNSSFFQVYERIGEKQETSPGSGVSVRECASQEEAIFRNYQWLLLEKKFLLVIPLSNYAGFATYDTGIFLVIEGNGIIGLTSAKKGKIPDGADPSTIKANGYWVKMGNEGIPGASHNPNYANNPDYGDSDILGDGRISVFGYPMFGASGVNGDVVLESLLGDGSVMPDVVAKNIAPIARLGFLQEDPYVASSDRTGKWSASWSSRNKVLPLLIAVFGQLRDGTYYDRTGEDESLHNYNYAGKHKYPIREVIEGLMVPLAKPHMRHFSDYGGRWVPRVKNEEGQNYACFASNNGLASDNGGFADTDDHYKPNDGLRSLLSVLAGDGDNATDGVLPLVTDPAKNIKLVSKVMALLQEMSGDSMTAARVTVGQGLEQILTGAKSNKGEIAQNNYSFIDNSNYGWMSTKRTEDLDLDIILDKIAQPDADWSTFDDFFNLGSHFIGGDRDITPRLANVVDAVLNQNLTAGQIQGVIYTLGKLFGKYEKGAWVYQGDDHGGADTFDPLYDLMMFIPQLNRYMGSSTVGLGDAGANYNLMMANIDKQVREPDSLARYLIKDMHTSYSMEQVFTDIGDFLRWKYVADPNSRLWNDLSSLLYDLSTVKDNQIDLNAFLGIYEFQRN